MGHIKPNAFAGVLLLGLAFFGGARHTWAQDVETDFDRHINFAALRTYHWVKADPVPGNDITNQRIVDAIDHWLRLKGLRKAPAGEADVAVATHFSTQEKQRLDTYYDGGYGYPGWGGWGWGGWGWGPGMATTTLHTYLEGTLVVDLFDARTNKLIWRGTGTDKVSDDPEKNARHIREAVEEMFEKFPPGIDDED